VWFAKFHAVGVKKSYIGETGRGLKTRISEHKLDVRDHKMSNAIVIHVEESNHLPRWDGASIMESGMSKPRRKALESAHILVENTINARTGFVTLARAVAKIAVQKK